MDSFEVKNKGIFIEGEWSDASDGANVPTINPATEKPVTEVASGTVEDANRAESAAKEAFEDGRRSKNPQPHEQRYYLR